MAPDATWLSDVIEKVATIGAAILGGGLMGKRTAKSHADAEVDGLEELRNRFQAQLIAATELRADHSGRLGRCERDISNLNSTFTEEVRRLELMLERNFRDLNRKFDNFATDNPRRRRTDPEEESEQ